MSTSETDLLITDKVQQDPIWALLTDKQKAFTLAFLQLRDKIAAAKSAYGTEDYKKSATQAARCLRNDNIRKILRNAGDTSLIDNSLVGLQEVLKLISARLRNAETDATAFVKLTQMYIGLRKMGTKDSGQSAEDVNEMVRSLEQKRKAANGS